MNLTAIRAKQLVDRAAHIERRFVTPHGLRAGSGALGAASRHLGISAPAQYPSEWRRRADKSLPCCLIEFVRPRPSHGASLAIALGASSSRRRLSGPSGSMYGVTLAEAWTSGPRVMAPTS